MRISLLGIVLASLSFVGCDAVSPPQTDATNPQDVASDAPESDDTESSLEVASSTEELGELEIEFYGDESDPASSESTPEPTSETPPDDVFDIGEPDPAANTDATTDVKDPTSEKDYEILQAINDLGGFTYDPSEQAPGHWEIDLDDVSDFAKALELVKQLDAKLIAVVKLGDDGTDERVQVISRLTNVPRLDLSFNENITDAGIKHLAAMKHLRGINLRYTKGVTAEGVKSLAGLTELEILNLGEIPLGGELHQFAELKKLRELELSHCKLTDVDVAVIANFPDLRVLDLSSNRDLTAACMQHLANLKLEKLDLTFAKVDDASLTHIAQMTGMKRLHLDYTNVIGPGLKHLAGMTELEDFEIGGSDTQAQFTGEGLEHLVGCTKLQRLDLSGTGVTDAGLAQVKKLKQLTVLDLPPYGTTSGLNGEFWQDGHPERLTDVGIKHISEMENLTWLWIAGSGITDEGYLSLKNLKNLEYLGGLGLLPNVKNRFELRESLPELDLDWR